MSTPVTIPNLSVVFPSSCVCCGEPRETESALTITHGNSEPLKLMVPHCKRCANGTKAVFRMESPESSKCCLRIDNSLGCLGFIVVSPFVVVTINSSFVVYTVDHTKHNVNDKMYRA